MKEFKSLFGDTIIYGGGTILVRLLNWFLMPYYIRNMDSLQYGVITEIYSYIAFFLVLLTYGFETTYFRYAKNNDQSVFKTALSSIIVTSIIFILVFLLFSHSILSWFGKNYSLELIISAGLVVTIDAVTALFFAKLRLENRSLKFTFLKVVNILCIIGFNILFLREIPLLLTKEGFEFLHSFYSPGNEAFYVLFSNLIASTIVFLLVIKDLKGFSSERFQFSLLKKMYKYTWPILIVGIAGMINQNLDKILIPKIIKGDLGLSQLGIYGANFKIGVLMAMFTQSFRMAFEPFFFKYHHETNDLSIYGNILRYFVLFGLFIFLGVILFIDIINLVLVKDYLEGNIIIPFVLIAQLLSGIYFTMSVWYKLSDKTYYGAIIGVIGSLVTIILNFILISKIGFLGAAISGLVCYFSMVLMSYFIGKKVFYIDFNFRSLFKYIVLVLVIYLTNMYFDTLLLSFRYLVKTSLLIVFLLFIYKWEYSKVVSML